MKTEDILAWLDERAIFIYRASEYGEAIEPSIPYPTSEVGNHRSPWLYVQARIGEHKGHPRQEFPCYLQFGFRTPNERSWRDYSDVLAEVISYYPNAEYTFHGFMQVCLHFNKEDSINLILQLGLN